MAATRITAMIIMMILVVLPLFFNIHPSDSVFSIVMITFFKYKQDCQYYDNYYAYSKSEKQEFFIFGKNHIAYFYASGLSRLRLFILKLLVKHLP